MRIGTAEIIKANAMEMPLADASVDLIVTSPPYFSLRSYQDGGNHYEGQIGSEETPQQFLEALWTVMAECWRVLKPSGSCWVNLGDKYCGYNANTNVPHSFQQEGERKPGTGGPAVPPSGRKGIAHFGVRNKSLMGLPWRFAIGCVDGKAAQNGEQWILRAEIVWDKPNGLPESVTDRVRRSHEQWFHFTKSPQYFAAVDEIREPHLFPLHSPGLGRLPGSVWRIATEPLRVPAELGIDHFAAFPTEFPRRIVLGWSPSGICVECGDGRRPVVESAITRDRGGRQFNPSSGNIGMLGREREYRVTGYACACPEPTAPTKPAVVLDPFGGTGTTALVAKALGRSGITIDLSADYCRLAEWRTSDPQEIRDVQAKTYGIKREVPQVPEGQIELFGDGQG